MPANVTMNDKQHVSASLTILDEDGQPYSQLPSGATSEFSSSDPTVADFAVDSSGLSGDVSSGKVGSAIITGRARLPDGLVFEDTLAVSVVNSDPAGASFTVGTPIAE